MSLKDLGKVEFQNTRGAGLNALGLGATDATVAESSEAEKWLAANPGKGRVLLTSRIVPHGEHSEARWSRQIPFFINTLLYEQS